MLVLLAICALGVSAIVTQLTLMRELLSAFCGNEMILGIVLGNWLLLTGAGAWLGRTASRLRRPLLALAAAQVLVALLPIAQVFGLRSLRNVVFVRGAMVGVVETVLSCFVLLLPYCLVAGYLLTLACRVLARGKGPESIGQVYFLDNIGDILGGLAFTFVLVHLLDHFGILYVPAFLNLLLAVAVAVRARSGILAAVGCAVGVGLLAAIMLLDLDKLSTRLEYAGRRVAYRGNSPYGNLVVTRSAGQYDFIENGVPLFSTYQVGEAEETVHYAMAQRPDARQVLLISGGVSGTAREILKYDVQHVDYVELDPLIVEIGRRFAPQNLPAERVRVVNTDGRLWVKQADRRYDVVIADVADPSTSQLNRFYTVQFYQEVKGILAADGVLSVSVGHYENYVSRELARLISVTHRTLRRVFRNVTIVPGGRIFFLASDGELVRDVAPRLEQRGIRTRLVNRQYLQVMLSRHRTADVERALSPEAPVNRDYSPVLYYYHLLHWLSHFRVSHTPLLAALCVLAALYLLRVRPVPLAIFTTGFTASGLVVVLMLAFQVLYGSVYHRLGLLVTAFMMGLAIGSWTMNRMLARRTRRDLARLELAVAAFAALLPAALIALGRVPAGGTWRFLVEAALAFLSLLLAVLVGMEFPLAGKAHFRAVTTTAAQVYTADYVGACLGALLVSTFLLPLIGMVWVCLLAAALNCVSGAVLWLTRGA
jgi:spermidine synthase